MTHPTVFFYNDSHIVGGHELLTARIINHLTDRMNIPVVLCYSCDDFPRHLSANVQICKLPFHGKTPSLFTDGQYHIGLIRKILRTVKPALAVIAQGYIESGVRGVIASRQEGVRTGSYIPFGNTNRELKNRFASVRDLISLPVYAMNQFYITISPYQKRMLSRLIGEQPVHLINNPVSWTDEPPAAAVHLANLSAGQPLQLAVIGRILFKQKNQDLMVQAARLLTSEQVAVHFHIIGDGPDMTALKAMIDNNQLNDLFTLHGWLDQAELAACRDACDAVVMPSHYEGLPLTFIESLFAGKPVLTSALPFLEDFPLPDAYQFDPGSARELADAIQRLPSLPLADDLARLQQHILNENSYPRFCADIESTFTALLPKT